MVKFLYIKRIPIFSHKRSILLSWKQKEILLIVKTYPERSKKYGNTVCTAGILKDTNELIRLYPFNFNSYISKHLEKFICISAQIKKNTKERLKRKESYNVKDASIKIINTDLIDTNKKGVWDTRRRLLKPFQSDSIESLVSLSKIDRTSLGIIKPKLKTVEFKLKKPIEEIEIDIATGIQLNLYGKKLRKVDKIEKAFFYKFKCEGENCKVHNMICTDWELMQSFRSWKEKYKDPEELVENLTKKYQEWMKNRDLHFILGTHNVYNTWFIIGLFYPPRLTERSIMEYINDK